MFTIKALRKFFVLLAIVSASTIFSVLIINNSDEKIKIKAFLHILPRASFDLETGKSVYISTYVAWCIIRPKNIPQPEISLADIKPETIVIIPNPFDVPLVFNI